MGKVLVEFARRSGSQCGRDCLCVSHLFDRENHLHTSHDFYGDGIYVYFANFCVTWGLLNKFCGGPVMMKFCVYYSPIHRG